MLKNDQRDLKMLEFMKGKRVKSNAGKNNIKADASTPSPVSELFKNA